MTHWAASAHRAFHLAQLITETASAFEPANMTGTKHLICTGTWKCINILLSYAQKTQDTYISIFRGSAFLCFLVGFFVCLLVVLVFIDFGLGFFLILNMFSKCQFSVILCRSVSTISILLKNKRILFPFVLKSTEIHDKNLSAFKALRLSDLKQLPESGKKWAVT